MLKHQTIRFFLQYLIPVFQQSFAPRSLHSIETFTNDRTDTCATVIQISTSHAATLPTRNIGYIEVPITNEKPKYYQVHDINSSVHNVAHTYHPELTEPIVTTNYASQSTDDTSYHPQLLLNQIYVRLILNINNC